MQNFDLEAQIGPHRLFWTQIGIFVAGWSIRRYFLILSRIQRLWINGTFLSEKWRYFQASFSRRTLVIWRLLNYLKLFLARCRCRSVLFLIDATKLGHRKLQVRLLPFYFNYTGPAIIITSTTWLDRTRRRRNPFTTFCHKLDALELYLRADAACRTGRSRRVVRSGAFAFHHHHFSLQFGLFIWLPKHLSIRFSVVLAAQKMLNRENSRVRHTGLLLMLWRVWTPLCQTYFLRRGSPFGARQ